MDRSSRPVGAGRSIHPAVPSATSSESTPVYPLVTTRVGLIFVAVCSALLACAYGAALVPEKPSLQPLLWIVALACCSVGGLLAMTSVRSLRTVECELRRCHTGRPSWESVRPIIGHDPATLGWNQLVEDAATQQHAPQRRPASLDHEVVTLARAMRGLPVAWVITDTEGSIRFLAQAACGLLNLSEDESQSGKDLPALLGLRDEGDPTAGPACERLLGPIRMVHQRRSVEIAARKVSLRVTRSRLSGRSGDGEGMAWVLTDITQQQIATEARDHFLMTATHELRTPLNNLQAYAEALQEEDQLEIERQKEFCNVINSEANRLGRLVDQLLTVSQMEAGSMVANRHELELLPIIEYAADQLRGHANQKEMTLNTNLSAKLPTVFGDRDKLQAALTNLVGNAIKYTPEQGGVSLRCAADERWIRISVEDNGPGIPEDEQERVFEKFYRGAATLDSDQRGNGLGLAFAREIARLHGGDIELHSVVGEGSVFTLRLPVGGRSRSGV